LIDLTQVAVRRGDVLALMIYIHFQHEDYTEARTVLDKVKDEFPRDITYYVDEGVIAKLCDILNLDKTKYLVTE
jgi:hypothetical protein